MYDDLLVTSKQSFTTNDVSIGRGRALTEMSGMCGGLRWPTSNIKD